MILGLLVGLLCVGWLSPGRAQTPGLDTMLPVAPSLSGPAIGAVPDTATPVDAADPPSGSLQRAAERTPPPSPLEILYSNRAGTPLRLFGYRLFDTAAPEGRIPRGLVGDDYIVGPGDRLSLLLRGAESVSRVAEVTPQGIVTFDPLPPIFAAGQTLGALKAEVAAIAAAEFNFAETYLDLAAAREVNVLVLGEVARPGFQRLSAFSTVLDALVAAGGPLRQGSLRDIRLLRGGLWRPIDLYGLLLEGEPASDPTVRDGDRVVVPVLGDTAAVAGLVHRPGIFELPAEAPGPASVEDVLRWAGGRLIPGAGAPVVLRLDDTGVERGVRVERPRRSPLVAGDIVLVQQQPGARRHTVELHGAVVAPGPHPIEDGDLRRVLSLPRGLRADAYRSFAVIESRDPQSGAYRLTAVDLVAVAEGRRVWTLQPGDRVLVLSEADIAFLSSEPVLAILRGPDTDAQSPASAIGAEPPAPGRRSVAPTPLAPEHMACTGLFALARAWSAEWSGGTPRSALADAADILPATPAPCRPLFKRFPEILPFALRHAAVVRGDGARAPGFYPVAGTVAAAQVIDAEATDAAGARLLQPGSTVILDQPQVRIDGPIRAPGARPLDATPTLRRLIAEASGPDDPSYPLFGLIVRPGADGATPTLQVFSPLAVRAGLDDLPLARGDRVHLFRWQDLQNGSHPSAAGAPDRPEARTVDGAPNRDGDGGGGRDGAIAPTAPDQRPLPGAGLAPATPQAAALRASIARHAVTLRGAVARPGRYPIAGATALATLLETAGGPTAEAALDAVEVTRPRARGRTVTNDRDAPERIVLDLAIDAPATLRILPGDTVRVPEAAPAVVADAVTVEGEVARPGRYDLIPGETIADLLVRAGGLTPLAYPDGAVFLRARVRAAERREMLATALQLEQGLASALAASDRPDPRTISLVEQLASELRALEPPGRIVVEADPDILALEPQRDLLLEPGDRLVIPKRPGTVRVVGEVQAPGPLQFRAERSAADYLRLAGGTTRLADLGRAYVIWPDGEAAPLSIAAWNYDPILLVPGSTVVVPKDSAPFDFLQTATSISSILGQLALTAASFSVLTGD